MRDYYAPFDSGPKSGTAEVYMHEMPGGQYTNLKEQAESMGLGPRWPEIARTYADVNMAFGDIVKVTPSSKVVGDMALFLVNHNMTMRQFEELGPDHNLTLPTSVVEMFAGDSASPRAAGRKQLQKRHPAGREAQPRPPGRAPRRRGFRCHGGDAGEKDRARAPRATNCSATSCTRMCS